MNKNLKNKKLENKDEVQNAVYAAVYNPYLKFCSKNVDYSHRMMRFVQVFCLLAFLLPLEYVLTILGIICGYINIYKLIAIFLGIMFNKNQSSKPKNNVTEEEKLPLYTILIPLYNEPNKVGNILKAMKNIDYPKDKLEIYILVEEDDIATKRAIEDEILPSYIKVMKIPLSTPRTKPKALNYALYFANGEYLVVYDAEDIPDSLQLRKVVYGFRELSSQYICIQCKLNFYNAKENLIAEFMSMEYSCWFDYIFKGLEISKLPIMLGGTSNHFKTCKLKEIGGWDSYNVTEDAELTLRVYMNKYKIKLINSLTLEEAPTNARTLIFQRSRWIKGFFQTFISYFRVEAMKKFTLVENIFFLTNFFLSSCSILLGPFIIICSFFVTSQISKWNLYLFILLHFTISILCNAQNGSKFNFKYFILSPGYYALHSLAFLIALKDLIKDPFYWRKTNHGESNVEFEFESEIKIDPDPK